LELFCFVPFVQFAPFQHCHSQTTNNNKKYDENLVPTDNHGLLHWKTVERNPRKTVHQIDRIDNFENRNQTPLLRFRSSLVGPCIAECFANYIMDYEHRRRWDAQISSVDEIIRVRDMDYANIAMGFGRYGDCARLGVGHCTTKAGLGISPREQLTLCGIQNFPDGSVIIWGRELPASQDHLFPPCTARTTRARSHLFASTLTPTSATTFDVEYVLQLDIGGRLPTWLTTPIVIDSVQKMFQTVELFFLDQREGSELSQYLQRQQHQREATTHELVHRQGLLMTP
jgi:hypothetical protein